MLWGSQLHFRCEEALEHITGKIDNRTNHLPLGWVLTLGQGFQLAATIGRLGRIAFGVAVGIAMAAIAAASRTSLEELVLSILVAEKKLLSVLGAGLHHWRALAIGGGRVNLRGYQCLAHTSWGILLTKTLEAAVTAAPSEGVPATVVAMAAKATPTSVMSFMMET